MCHRSAAKARADQHGKVRMQVQAPPKSGEMQPIAYLSKEFLSCLQPDFIIMNISAWPYFQLLHVLPAIKTVLSRLDKPLTAGLHFALAMLNVYALRCVPD